MNQSSNFRAFLDSKVTRKLLNRRCAKCRVYLFESFFSSLFSRAVTCARRVGLQPLGKLALRLNTEVPHWLEHFHTWCIGWSTASAVQLGFGNETALATEVTETLPQALKRDPRNDGSYASMKSCSTHRLYTRCETAIEPGRTLASHVERALQRNAPLP